MRVTISGPPGSGKTTIARLVTKKLGLKLIMTGKIFREQAKKAGMDVHEYNQLAEKDRKIDECLDDEIVALARIKDNVVIEGRLAGQLLHKNKIDSYKIFVTAPSRVRAERIAKRERTKAEDELKNLTIREESEKKRYLEFYKIDVGDLSIYDLILDSSDISAEEASEIAVGEIRKMES